MRDRYSWVYCPSFCIVRIVSRGVSGRPAQGLGGGKPGAGNSPLRSGPWGPNCTASVSVLILPRDPHLKKAIGYGVHLCPAFYMISDHLKSQKMPYGILHRTWGLERMPLDKRNRSHFRCLYIFGYRNQSLFLDIIQQGQLCQE